MAFLKRASKREGERERDETTYGAIGATLKPEERKKEQSSSGRERERKRVKTIFFVLPVMCEREAPIQYSTYGRLGTICYS